MRMVIEMIKLVIYVVLLFLGFCLLTDSTILNIYNVCICSEIEPSDENRCSS